MKIGQREIDDKWVVLGVVVLLAIALAVFVNWPKDKPTVSPSQTVNDVKVALEKQYMQQFEDKEKQIRDYQTRLTASESKYKVLVDKYVDLERRKNDVKPPVTDAETRDRFTAAGYPPIPLK